MEISKKRKLEICNPNAVQIFRQKMRGFNHKKEFEQILETEIR